MEVLQSKALGELVDVGKLVVALGATESRSEANRLIKQGAVEIDGEIVGREACIYDGSVLQYGKRFWRRLELPPKK